MTRLLIALFGCLAVGCIDMNPTTTATPRRSDAPVTVTANRPVLDGDDATDSDATDRTNSGVNVRDRDDATKTPFDQNENKEDIRITADIRSKVVDTNMSVDAQNVKIITQDGMVTLRGPVQTEQEKQNIERIAKDVAGADKVDSQLEVDKDE